VSLQHSILTLAGNGWSHRRIARELNINRETVGRYLRLANAKPAISTPGSSAGRQSLCQPWLPQIEAAMSVGLTAQRIYQDLVCDHGFVGSYQAVIAFLEAENIDWEHNVISFARKKTGSIALMRFDEEMAELLRSLPDSGPLFPYLRTVRAGDRATEFHQRCVGLKIKGVTLHSYRYAWAERAKTAGYPERFAQEALGHNSKAVHRAYARKAKVELPSLGEYERQRKMFAEGKIAEPVVQIANA
jgi:integrase-like protein